MDHPGIVHELVGDETAREAITHTYQILLDTITRNIAGVLADNNPEFLHDLRVAISRTRFGLSLAKQVLPDSVSKRFSRVIRRLGALTGTARDLDVFLLRKLGSQKAKSRLAVINLLFFR